MPQESSPAFTRTPISVVSPVGGWAGTDARVLIDNLVLGFRGWIESLRYIVGPTAGAGASGTQSWLLRKGASASVLTTTLAANPAAGATNMKLTSVTGISVGQWLTIETPDLVECRKITAVGTAGGAGTGVDVSEGFTNDHASGAVAKVHANPILAVVNLAVADATVGKVVAPSLFANASTADPRALYDLARFGDTDGLSLTRAAGGTAYTTEPSGTFLVVARQKPQAKQ